MLIGGHAVVRALWSVVPRGPREVLDDAPFDRRSKPPPGIAPDWSPFGAELDRGDPRDDRAER